MMNRKNQIFLVTLLGLILAFVGCQNGLTPERIPFENQEGLKRHLPKIEVTSEDQLTPSEKEYYAAIREYKKTPHVKGFGWFGNWTGKGDNPQNYLKFIPDSVDFVSLWGCRGNLTPEQQTDLKFFQNVMGSKALLCWIVQNLGDQMTPPGLDPYDYWVDQKGGGDFKKGVEAYALAICDTIIKYDLDGFDIDYEPGYGHSGSLANWLEIGPDEGQNNNMYVFIKTMYDKLNPLGKMIVMDGQPDKLSTETSKMIDHYIYQAYWERHTSYVQRKISKPHLTDWERKTIITVEFEQTWRNGGVTGYISSAHPEFNGKPGAQIFDYATLDLPSGLRIGGIGTYHMEYDYPNDPPYKWLRTALYMGNVKYPGNYQ